MGVGKSVERKISSINNINFSNKFFQNKRLNHTILKFEIKEETIINNINSEFIFICDCSDSMSKYSNIIITKVIPKVFEKINYLNEQIIHLIIFRNDVDYIKIRVIDLKDSKISGFGNRCISKIPEILKLIFDSISPEKLINLLILSNGVINDSIDSKNEFQDLYKSINEKYPNINSQAIRFISKSEIIPDTKALCLFLQFNNINFFKSEDLFINYDIGDNINSDKINELSDIIAKIFYRKITGWKVASKEKNLFFDINGPAYSSLELVSGKYMIIYNSIFEQEKKVPEIYSNDGSIINFIKDEDVNENNYILIYEDIIINIFKNFLINKVIGNKESEKNLEEQINFIKEIENENSEMSDISEKVSDIFEKTQNDEKINTLLGEQLKDYLNEKIKECQERVKGIINKIKKNNIKNTEFLILIDSSKIMENYIDHFIQNILYNTILKMGFEENNKLKILGFNSTDVDENYIQIKKMPKHKIICEGERELFNALDLARETMEKYSSKNFFLLTIISGDIKDNKNLNILAYKLLGLNEKIKIKSRIIKYIINESDFSNNPEYNTSYNIINRLNKDNDISVKPLEIYENEDDNEKIRKIIEIFGKN